MLLDFEVQRCTRRCAATDRPLAPGESCYSVLEVQGAEVVRRDYCGEAWDGPPEGVLGWWKSQVPEPTAKKLKLAPNDVLLELFDQLGEGETHLDMRYVLALLLVRRRVFRTEGPATEPDADGPADGVERLVVFCPKRDATYEVAAVMPSDGRVDEIQQQLGELLVAGAE